MIRSDRSTGQGLVEFALIVAGVLLVATVLLVAAPDAVAALLDLVGNAVDGSTRTR